MSQNESSRDREITKTSVIGIITNVLLASFKAVVGLFANSIAIVLDAVNNLSDALSSVITILGVKLAHKKPDKQHPYGHGRVEYLSGIVIACIVFAAGVFSLIECLGKIKNPELADYSTTTFVIISVAIITKLLLGRYVKKQGEKYRSDALIASGTDASFDAIISASTLVGAVITLVFNISIDAYIGALISIFIIKAGVELLMQPVNQMLGARANSEVTKSIKAEIRSMENIIGAYDLVLHDYGPDKAIGSVHVEVSDTLSAREIHLLTKRAQQTVKEKFGVYLTFGIYAVDNQGDEVGQMQHEIKSIANSFEGVLQSHGIFIDQERKYISFDIVVDFKVPDWNVLRENVIKKVNEAYPTYKIEINLDIDYSD